MEAQQDGFTQLLVVKSAKAAASNVLAELRLKLGAAGMDVTVDSHGGLEAVDGGAGGAVFAAPQPMMSRFRPADRRKGIRRPAGRKGGPPGR